MTLRMKVALALGALAAGATIIAATVSYVATADRLNSAVDSYLRQAAAQLARAGRPPAGTLPGALPGGPAGAADQTASILSRALGVPLGAPAPGNQPVRPGLLDLLVVQVLDLQGGVQSDSSSVRLPVSETDLLLAQRGGSPTLQTEYAGTVPYRMITVPRPAGGAIQLAQNQSETENTLRSLRARLALLALGITVAAVAAGWFIARRISSPLRRLADAAENVAGTGELDARRDVARRDEVGSLARSMIGMVDDLAESRRQQQRLVEDAGHELRTPLTSLRSNVEILQRYSGLNDEARTRLLEDLGTEIGQLTELVNEVVELATDRRREEPVTVVRLDEVARRVAERIGARSGHPVSVEAEPSSVSGRERALERAIGNLVDNAAKFSPPGAPVDVVVRRNRIEVHDRGPGIAPAEAERVFERFYRSDTARSLPGSGLGLSIVRQIAEEHGGRVFASASPAGGAVVGFELDGAPAGM